MTGSATGGPGGRTGNARAPRPLVDADPEVVLGALLATGRPLVVQVGANDGVRNDPLYPLFCSNPELRGILIEPLPTYFDQLTAVHHANAGRISVVNCAAGNEDGTQTLHYIDESVADEMDGDGPRNGWAHGQGSFSRDVIVEWIRRNAFRGQAYGDAIPRYIDSIRSTEIEVLTVNTILQRAGVSAVDVLVIDAQGHELDVLQGVDFSSVRPGYVYYEDDTGRCSSQIAELLSDNGYRYICGHDNRLWVDSAREPTGRERSDPASDGRPTESGDRLVDAVIMTCHGPDLTTWVHAQEQILRYLPAREFTLVVPEADIPLFRSVSSARVAVIGERDVLPDMTLETLAARLPAKQRNRAGWYLQQFLKLAACAARQADEVVLIWDPDTVPVRPLTFIRPNGNLVYYTGSEYHQPYFETLQRLTGLTRAARFSFIAQCLVMRARWAQEFLALIERRAEMPWHQAILESLRGSSPSEFSEYEGVGQYIYSKYRNQMELRNDAWERRGYATFGSLVAFKGFDRRDYYAFEAWEREADRGRPLTVWRARLSGYRGRLRGRWAQARRRQL